VKHVTKAQYRVEAGYLLQKEPLNWGALHDDDVLNTDLV